MKKELPALETISPKRWVKLTRAFCPWGKPRVYRVSIFLKHSDTFCNYYYCSAEICREPKQEVSKQDVKKSKLGLFKWSDWTKCTAKWDPLGLSSEKQPALWAIKLNSMETIPKWKNLYLPDDLLGRVLDMSTTWSGCSETPKRWLSDWPVLRRVGWLQGSVF